MANNRVALKEFFDDADPFKLLACRKFLRKPSPDIYPVDMILRVSEHNNGQDSDLPFQDEALIAKMKEFLKLAHPYSAQGVRQVHIYIPDYSSPHKRTLVIYGTNHTLTKKTHNALHQIFEAYRNDDLHKVDIASLAAPFRHDRDEAVIRQKTRVERAPQSEAPETSIGRIKFSEELDVSLFNGERKRSFRRLREFLQQELQVSFVPAPNRNCIDLEGDKRNVHIAYFMGKKLASYIDNEQELSHAQIRAAYKRAERRVGEKTVDTILGENRDETADRSKKVKRRDDLKHNPDALHKADIASEFRGDFRTWADMIEQADNDSDDLVPQGNVKYFTTPAP